MRYVTSAKPGPAESLRGLQECQPETVRRFRTRRQLRLEQRGDEKAMAGQFHRSYLAADPSRTDAQSRRLKLRLVLLVDAVVAVLRRILWGRRRDGSGARMKAE